MDGSRPFYVEKDKCHMISLSGLVVKNQSANAGAIGLTPGSGRSPEKEMETHSSILPGKSHEQRRLVGYSPWGPKESDMT